MVKLSAKEKFVLINLDEFVILLFALAAVYWFLPQYFLIAVVIAAIGFTLFIIAKYYLVYPVLDDTSKSFDVVGFVGEAVTDITPDGGRVRIGQEIWNARSTTGTILNGSSVKVLKRDGLILSVAHVENS